MKRMLSLLAATSLCLAASPGAVAQQAGGVQQAPGSQAAQALSSQGVAHMNAWMDRAVKAGRVPGGVILLMRDGKAVHQQSYGLADRDSKRVMTNDAIFRIYSMTKPVISAALLTLYDEGYFQLNDPLEDYLPEFKDAKVYTGEAADGSFLTEPARRKPTILDALRHTVGVSAGGGRDPLNQEYEKRGILVGLISSLSQQMELLGQMPLHFHPGDQWMYGFGHDIQAALVERLTGMRVDEYVHKRIFGPLGMHDSFYKVPSNKRSRIATLHDVPETPPAMLAVDMRPSTYERFGDVPIGTLGMWSTASDFARFGQMLLNGGELEGQRVLSRKTVELMASNNLPPNLPSIRASEPGTGYGLGVSVQTNVAADGNLGSVGAFGWSGAGTTHFIVDPRERLVAVLMTQKAPFDSRFISEFQTMTYQSLK